VTMGKGSEREVRERETESERGEREGRSVGLAGLKEHEILFPLCLFPFRQRSKLFFGQVEAHSELAIGQMFFNILEVDERRGGTGLA
jgi:hypothetical protein